MTATRDAPAVTMYTTHVVRLLRPAEEADAARGHRVRRGRHRGRRATPPSWSCRPTAATAPCPRCVFADGSALTNPSIDQVKAQLGQLSGGMSP